nr:LOW QUALITY PROTEIN: CCR4-NOT transcription complex subunit 7-like [Rhipicephalus microplus]
MSGVSEALSKLSFNSSSSGSSSSNDVSLSASSTDNRASEIRDVWAYNLDEEFYTIRSLVRRYNYIAMDTEFPGVVTQPVGTFRSSPNYQYQMMRCNVDLLKIIQLGITFFDEHGNKPEHVSTWQFNFKFSLSKDRFAQDSIDLLVKSGIKFRRHEVEGIEPYEFAQLLMSSGLVLLDEVKWLTFHSGYDFGYLLEMLTGQNLPVAETDFFETLKLYFPCIYDVKYLMKSCGSLRGGLQEVAGQLQIERVGLQHQAGSDSLLTGETFFKIRKVFFQDKLDDAKFCGFLYGLGASYGTYGDQTFEVDASAHHIAQMLSRSPLVVYSKPGPKTS